MNPTSFLTTALLALVLAAPSHGQPTAAPAASPAASADTDLVALVGPRAAELSGAGVEKIVARTDKGKRNIQVLTKYGALYFGWPKGAKPIAFTMELGRGPVVVHASDHGAAARARYAAAFDALIPEVLDRTAKAKAWAERPRT